MSNAAQTGLFNRFLNAVERIGNKLPHITILFMWALLISLLISLGLSYVDFNYVLPSTGEKIRILNMLSADNFLGLILSSTKNFMNFPPLGITIVATLGIGIAESSGYISVVIKKFLSITPQRFLTPTVILVSILCHIVSDSAYTILMPVSALMFYVSGRHPLAGIACSFAGLAGGFTASFTPSIIDPIMQSFTEHAAHIVDPTYSVNVLCNYFVSLGGTLFVTLACWFVTDRIVEPRLKFGMPVDPETKNNASLTLKEVSAEENRAYHWANAVAIGLLVLLFALCWPDNSILRAPDGSLTSPKAPAMQGIVPFMLIFFSLPSLVYGFMVRTFTKANDVIDAMQRIMQMLIGFMVFCFFAGQFLYVFGKSGIGSLLAVAGAEFLKSLALPSGLTLFGIIILTAVLNLIITSATSKWAILSTIFVPMLMLLGISPELTQAAFRVSDSAVNVCTPLFAFYPLLIMYCQRYCKKAGVGTLSSMMLPYTIALMVVLTSVLYLFWFLGIPLGFESGYDYPSTLFPKH